MTSVISEDTLRGQQSRIMRAMRAATQPAPGADLQNIASSLMTQNNGGASYFDTMRKLNQDQTKINIDAETGIYNQMKEQVARGNAEAKGVDDAIAEVAGSDPKLYASILQDLHSDPDPVNAQNAKAKVMKYASQRGITPLSVQGERAKINKLNADATNTARGGDKTAAQKEYEQLQKMTEEERKLWFRNKRASGEDKLDETLGREGGKKYGELQTKTQEVEGLVTNIDIARDALQKAKMTGPLFGRIGKAASEPNYVNWQGAKNGLTLLAKSIYGMPNANFSDADRDFLDEITGGRFPSKEAAEKTLDRLDLLASKALRNARKHQKDILDRKTYNRDSPVEDVPDGGKVAPKALKDTSDDELKKLLGL